jgi:hypothetical protein
MFAIYNAHGELFIDCETLTAVVGFTEQACIDAYGPMWGEHHADGLGLEVRPATVTVGAPDLKAATWQETESVLTDGSRVYGAEIRNACGDLLCRIDCEDGTQSDELLRKLDRAAV